AVAERLEQEAELLLDLRLGQPEDLEHAGLDVGAVDPDRAAADLVAVEDEVVGLGEDLARVGRQQVELVEARRGERVMGADVAALALLEQREVGDPEELPRAPARPRLVGLVLADEVELVAEL